METVKYSFKCTIQLITNLKLFYLEIPREVLLQLNKGEEKGLFDQRVWIEIGKELKWQGGIVALGKGNGYITISKARMKELDIHFGDEIEAFIYRDTSQYGMEMTEEFAAVLEMDEVAKNRFEALKMGTQRYMLYFTLQVKSSQKRLERAMMMLENLKHIPPGEEDFRKILGKD